MRMDLNLHNVLPAVFLKVLTVLENENEPVLWNLSRNRKGFSLSIKSPAKRKDVNISTNRPQDTEKAVPVQDTYRKKKRPSRARRDRRRWTAYYQKKKSGTSSSSNTPKDSPKPASPVVTKQLELSQEVLDPPSSSAKQDISSTSEQTTRLDQPVCLEQSVQGDVSVSCSDIDSDDDEEVIEYPNFCATCYRAPPVVTLKKCSKCQISQYCSLSCQKENWKQHKFACSIVADQRSSEGQCK